MKKKFAGLVAALITSVSLFAMAGPASAVTGCDYSNPELQYACVLFGDFSNRTFDFDEASYWAGVGQQYGHVVEANFLLHSVEIDAQLVDEGYNAFLGRPAIASPTESGDPVGLQFWTNAIMNHELSWEDVLGILADSAEGRAFRSNDEVTTILYQAFLGRTPTADELAYWSDVADSTNRLVVTQQITRSEEAAAHIVPLIYEEFLGRLPSADDQAYWGPIYQAYGFLDTIALIAGTNEAFTNLSQPPAAAVAGSHSALALLG